MKNRATSGVRTAESTSKVDRHRSWSTEDAAEMYRVAGWSEGYFEVGDNGHLMIVLADGSDTRVDLYELVLGIEERGVKPPVLVGLPQLVEARMAAMARAFGEAIADNDYRGGYAGVYPIKVNQHRHLVRDIERAGRTSGFGLEVGSKPELLAVMGLTVDSGDRLIICNGIKEERFIHHILLATKLGRSIIAVVESMDELEIVIRQARRLNVRPQIGLRLKLTTASHGRWQLSTGEKAKFGLPVPAVLAAVDRLREVGMLDCLKLLHCHMGSQISDIQAINAGLSELTRTYVELLDLGTGLEYLDVGGGLAIDYDGSQSNTDFSANYDLDEYASNVVYRIMAVCEEVGAAHPVIITESGRAMVSHHSILVTNVLGCYRVDRWALEPAAARAEVDALGNPRMLVDLVEAFEGLSEDSLSEAFHDGLAAREEALTHFQVGLLDLAGRGLADRIFWSLCLELLRLAGEADLPIPDDLAGLELELSDTYFCNMSVFQSLPDSWAIDQVFPIMPIHRLDEEPDRRATLADVTCDSDGKIDRFADPVEDRSPVLPVHSLRDGEPYYLGVFLVGAYQETLGDFHNLFGDINFVHVRVGENGRWVIEELVEGDSVAEVLSYLEYDPRQLLQAIRRDAERAVLADEMTVAESRELIESYEAGLKGSTYLE
jgi:arginine decarboxylase